MNNFAQHKFREVARGQNKEQREERQQELAKVRGARCEIIILSHKLLLCVLLRNFFQTITNNNSSMANPGVRLRSDEEIMDSYNSQSGKSKRKALL